MPGQNNATGLRLFASDNASGIHPAVLAAIAEANRGHALAYGNDAWTERARALFRQQFADDAEVVLAFGGTGANIVGLATLLQSHESIVCADTSHLWRDECAAPERWLGVKLCPVVTADGKLRQNDLESFLEDRGFVHRAQPRVVSVSQPTEWGTVYTIDELTSLADFCTANELFLHVDGARLANAAAALGVSLREASSDCGVDVLSFGGTKNGMLGGEAVLAFGSARDRGLPFKLKQGAQLASKMRFVAAQFEALLTDELWLDNARHANAMAATLAASLGDFPDIDIVQAVETNALFLRVPEALARKLKERFAVALWKSDGPVIRVMTSFDTTAEDLDGFTALLESAAG